jgi:hypothetical protein
VDHRDRAGCRSDPILCASPPSSSDRRTALSSGGAREFQGDGPAESPFIDGGYAVLNIPTTDTLLLAVRTMLPATMANDTGAFFNLYPYKLVRDGNDRGVLLGWAWGASRGVDALQYLTEHDPAKPVFQFLGAPQNLALDLYMGGGGHSLKPTQALDIVNFANLVLFGKSLADDVKTHLTTDPYLDAGTYDRYYGGLKTMMPWAGAVR